MKIFFATLFCIGLVSADTRPYLPASKPTSSPKQTVSQIPNKIVQIQEVPQVQRIQQVQQYQVQVQTPQVSHVQQVNQVQTPQVSFVQLQPQQIQYVQTGQQVQVPVQVITTPVVSHPVHVVSTSQTYKPTSQVVTQTYQPVVTGTSHIFAAGCSINCVGQRCVQSCTNPVFTQTTAPKPSFSVYGKKSVGTAPVQKTVTVTKEVQTKPIQRTVTVQKQIVPVVRTVVQTVPVVQRTIVQTAPIVQRTLKTVQYHQRSSVVQTVPVPVQTQNVVPVKEVTVIQTTPVQKKVVQTTTISQTPEVAVQEKQTVAQAGQGSTPAPQKETIAIFPTKAPVQPAQPVKQTNVQTTKHHVPGHNEVTGYKYSQPASH